MLTNLLVVNVVQCIPVVGVSVEDLKKYNVSGLKLSQILSPNKSAKKSKWKRKQMNALRRLF